MTPEQRNGLRAYINTDSGKAFLNLIVNEEIGTLAEAYSDQATSEKQVQKVNYVAALYWVRTTIDDLTKVTVSKEARQVNGGK